MDIKTHSHTGAAMSGSSLKRASQTTILAVGSALALITATAGNRAHGEGNLDASYTISFARIPVGEVTATAIFGQPVMRRRHNEGVDDYQRGRPYVALNWLTYFARSVSSDAWSGPPACAVPEAAAKSFTRTRIGSNGPNLCC